MRQIKREAFDRVLAMILSLMMVVAMMPMNVLAVGETSSVLTTNIGEKTFTVNEATEFTITTTANDDENIMVKGSFVFSDPAAIEKLEYLETADGNWYEFSGDFGPENGFPMIDGTSTFRVTFNKIGNYNVTASMKTASDGSVLCTTSKDIVVKGKASTLSTNIGEKTFNVGDVTEFTFTTIANDDVNKMVRGSFEFSDPTAIEKLEYLETENGNWYEFNGDFGPETGFPMSDETSTFRVTFSKAGNYTVEACMKEVESGTVLCTVNSDVTVEHKVTVSAPVVSGGSITLNGQLNESLTVDAGTDVDVKIEAEEGYQIQSVYFGNEEQSITDKNVFSKVMGAVSVNTEIRVVFVKVYTVTASYDGNGSVNITPAGGNGTVTVETGSSVKIEAVPSIGHHVSSVTINDTEQNVSGTNDSGYEETLTADKDYIVKITFAPNFYNITVNHASNGTVNAELSSVAYNGSTKVYLIPDEGYTVDTITVNDTSVTSVIKDENGIYFTLERIMADQTVVVSFKEIEEAEKTDASVNSDAALRTNDSDTLFVIKEGSAIIFSTEKSGIRVYNHAGTLIGGDEETLSVSVTETTTVAKVELYYQADDELYADWHIVNMEAVKVVVDKGENVTASLSANPVANENGYHNSDVTLEVYAEDTGDYSGISLVEYWITCNGSDGEKVTLYTYADGDILNIYENTVDLVVDASIYNSKDVKVSLHVVDRAGNEKTAEKTLMINSTAPTVTLDINGTQNPNALEGYYNDTRTLTITIVDRNDTFDAAAVATGMDVTENGLKKVVEESDITWVHNENTHIGTYKFTDDAKYEWSISYTNKAGKTNEGVVVPADKNIYNFTVDKAEPHSLKISYEPDFTDTLLENITFGFYQAPVKVTIEATDDTARIEQFVYSYIVQAGASATNTGKTEVVIASEDITRNGNKASATFKIPAQFRGSVSFSATDKAGRTTSISDDKKVVVVDDVAPGISVEYDKVDAINGKYYNVPRIATIKIEEANFFTKDIDDDLLVITVTKVLNDGTRSEENVKPVFTKNGDDYTATVEFAENADYTFDIKYTDRCGNVYDSYAMDEFTIDLIKPVIEVSYDNNTCLNNNQFKDKRKASIKVTEHNFDVSAVVAAVTENDVLSAEYASYLTNDANWAHNGDVHIAEIVFSGDADYTFAINCEDFAGNANEPANYGDSVAPQTFTVDKTGPENLKISYEPTFVEIVLETITFGFYKAPVKVKIEATDVTAGIDYFTYSYAIQESTSTTNIGVNNVVINKADITYDGSKAYASFEIPAQFRGYVSFTATDKAGNTNEAVDTKVVVVDDVAPGITVSYDNNNVKNGKYYDADRTATITITEANFFERDFDDGLLVITVGKTDYSGNYTETVVKPEFTKNGDVYTATVDFKENADYTFDIKYTDRSGNVYDSYEMDEFTIDKISPVLSIDYDNDSALNGNYFKADRVATITVVEHNFRASDIDFKIAATDVTGTKAIDLSTKGYASYLKNQDNWIKSGDKWTAQITLDIEGNYTISMKYTDLAGDAQEHEIVEEFCIDKSLPAGLKISYEPTFVGTILENLTFGFYKAPLKVIIEATDEYAGVDYFTYSYNIQEDASATNVGATNVVINSENIIYEGNKAMASFTINPQFRGFVSFAVTDKAGNTNSIVDDKVVVVDNVAPGVKVVYDNNNAKYDKYYNADRTAIITITEANFFVDDLNDEFLVITVGKTLNDGTYSETKMQPTFTKNGDVYTATILFAEDADYTFDIKYTDRSGNVYDSYEMDEFTVDKIKPVIEVSYDNNSCNNGNQFNADREATIVITEHNFMASNVVAKVMAGETELTSYSEYLTNEANWTHNGDVHTAKIKYTEEAHYTFEISYTDVVGNWNDGVNYGKSVAPTKFTLDKSAPTELTIKINDVSVLGTNSIAFDTFYAGEIAVKLAANCDISGLQSLKYQKVAAASEYDVNGTWVDYDSVKGIVVYPSEKFIIYFRAEDRAGNVSIVNSTGIVVDNQKPIGETKAPEIDILLEAPNNNGIYNRDIQVDLKVIDPKYIGATATENGHYSGLNKITYRIYTTDTDAEETGTLLDLAGVTDGAVFDIDKLICSWSGKIIIDSSKFNSNNVFVEVIAIDNAGNSRTSTTAAGEIKIDITTPQIEVSYDNNEADSVSYFKNDRTATIVVTERNFDAKDVVVTLTNTDGVIPVLSDWTKTAGSGNMDDTIWSATINYTSDGDYEFAIEYTDLAGWTCGKEDVNYGTSVVPTKFTIDHTIPTVTVSYDNNSVVNTNYYKDARLGTVVITEHNLDPNGADKDRIVITMTATDDGVDTVVPVVSAWRTDGDRHTATINYSGDARYSFDVAIKDKAGNESADFIEQSFYVDRTAPALEITGVANNSANNGDVIPVVSYSDTNYDSSQVTITLTGANRKSVELDGIYQDIHNGQIFTFKNFAEEKEIDDIYTLTATLTDKAGNTTTQTITFSVNRYGSTYALSESAEKLNGTYVKESVDVVITETNANELSNIKITLFKNGDTIVLNEGTDYEIGVEGGNGQWYHYTYTVFAKNFAEDGVYSLTIESDDTAGNEAKNNQDTKNTEINFGVDRTLPIINIENIESKTTYATENLTVKMSIEDNLKLAKVIVELDGKQIKVWSAEELEEIVKNGGNFSFDIVGDSTDAHKLVVYAVDAAGNGEKLSDAELPVNAEEVEGFYVTTNLWVRYYTNKPLFFGSIGGVILIAGSIVFLIVYKKRKKEKK